MKTNHTKKIRRILAAVLCVVSGMPAMSQLSVNNDGQTHIGFAPTDLSQLSGVLTIKGNSTLPALGCIGGYTNAGVASLKSMSLKEIPYVLRLSAMSAPTYFLTCSTNGMEKFYVNGQGQVFSQGNVTLSDKNVKRNIKDLSSSLQKIKKLRGVSYEFIEQENQEKGNKHIGLLAQEVEAIFPEVVYTLADGRKGIAYTELIGVLVEAIKEQQLEIENIKAAMPSLKKENTMQGESNTTSERTVSVLYQNAPNPFNRETRINYFLPSTVSAANLLVYDLQGKQLKNYRLKDRGEAFLIIDAGELGAGMYIYALVADEQAIDQKRMIITE